MEKRFFKSLFNALKIEEAEYHKYLCKLIEVLGKNIGKEINLNIYSRDFRINELEKLKSSSKGIDSFKGIKPSFISWENTIWSALFLSIYINFESKLNHICLIIMERDNIELSYKDLRDSGLTRARKYLLKVAKYKFSIPEDKWQLSEKYNRIRNILAHNEGRLQKDNNKYQDNDLYNYIKSNPYLKIDKFDKLFLTKTFVLEVQKSLNNIYLTICNELASLD